MLARWIAATRGKPLMVEIMLNPIGLFFVDLLAGRLNPD